MLSETTGIPTKTHGFDYLLRKITLKEAFLVINLKAQREKLLKKKKKKLMFVFLILLYSLIRMSNPWRMPTR